MKRRSNQPPKLRDRREGMLSSYCREGKRPFDYRPMYKRLIEHEPSSVLAKHLRQRGV